MSFYAWEDGVLLIAVDPAQKVSAVAWRGRSKDTGRAVQGTKLVADILDSSQIDKVIRSASQGLDFQKVWIAVEYPKWNAGASQTVRAAANTYVRLLRRIFPRAEVVKVSPEVWQGFFQFKNRPPTQSTKDFSLWLATKAYGWAVGAEHDRADAALILEWLRANPPAPKPKQKSKRKKPPGS